MAVKDNDGKHQLLEGESKEDVSVAFEVDPPTNLESAWPNTARMP